MSGLHVAIIMDGNGRWAAERGLPRIAGHGRGVESVRQVVEAAPDLGVSTLTLFAFSEDNWRRPAQEVSGLFGLLKRYLAQETERCLAQGVRLEAIGRRDRLPVALQQALEESEARTRDGRRLHLRIALDYSARSAVVEAANRVTGSVTRESLAKALGPDVDLLIRTSGEQRLRDFLLWESAYAELYFTERPWPEFGARELGEALASYCHRDRRFGGLSLKTA